MAQTAPKKHRDDEPSGRRSANETSPLIGSAPSIATSEAAEQTVHFSTPVVHRQTVLLLLCVIMFVSELGGGMIVPPSNALMEDIICRDMKPRLGAAQRHPTLLTDDDICKGPEVQGKLALYRGWLYIAEATPGMLTAIPYGLLADRWGRRPVLTLAITGFFVGYTWYCAVLYFPEILPLWMILLFPVATLVGGSFTVVLSTVYTYIADVVPVEDRAVVLFEVTGFFYVAELVAAPLGGYLMGDDGAHPWTPMLLSAGCLLLTIALTCFLPETLGLRNATKLDSSAANGEDLSGEGDGEMDEHVLKRAWKLVKGHVTQVWTFVLRDRNVAWLLLAIFFLIFGRFVQEILLQYSTKRYHWSWAKASYYLSARTITTLAMYFLALRAISHFLTVRFNMLPIRRDLLLARVCGVILVIGCLIIAFSVNAPLLIIGIVTLAVGGCVRQLVLSLLNSLVEPHHIGLLNGVVGVLQMAGVVLAASLMSESLNIGLHMGGLWIGLPFLVAALASLVSTVILFLFRPPAVPPADVLGVNPLAERFADEELAA